MLIVIWVIVATGLLWSLTEDIEKCDNEWKKSISCILVVIAAPVMVVAGVVLDLLEWLGVNMDE